ncbi:hypothetical protein C2S52_014145 [Perilla frutescens var. hirtella]|nr:hypothetical protein C2S52_014145 [Perilla frutescens var. hirtella]
MPRGRRSGRGQELGHPLRVEEVMDEDPMSNLYNMFLGMAQQFTATQNTQVQMEPDDNTSRVIEQFRKYQPPIFDGRGEPTSAEGWLHTLKHIFNHIMCTDIQQVSCAVFQLVEDADHWWESHKVLDRALKIEFQALPNVNRMPMDQAATRKRK